jgi:predicted dehydrogenase
VHAHGDPLGWAGLFLEHRGGGVSQIALSMAGRGDLPPARVDVLGRKGSTGLDLTDFSPAVFARVAEEFAHTVREGGGHALDAAHGLRMQRIIEDAERQCLSRSR